MLPRISRRYELLRQIGAGGMGAVYEALDRERGGLVALKTLARMDPSALMRFKQEFRSLAELVHPNLVRLYEFHEENGVWFFTMELVDGVDLVRYTRRDRERNTTGPLPGQEITPSLTSLPTVPAFVTPSSGRWDAKGDKGGAPQASSMWEKAPSDPVGMSPETSKDPRSQAVSLPTPSVVYDRGRLLSALRQLGHALLTVHEHGKVHRDVKPSNILVTVEDRVVLLDFGLVIGMDHESDERLTGAGFAGTAAYMAPETASEPEVGPAADWYSVGVILYEILTGRLPFDGAPLEIIIKKQTERPVSPMEYNADCDGDLADLAMRLLSRSAQSRPSGAEVLKRLGETGEFSKERSCRSLSLHQRDRFIGRRRELARVEELWKRVLAGHGATAVVTGPSGIGKTALMGHFRKLVQETTRAPAFVFSGKCYERETVPFKAFDSVVDRMTSALLKLDRRGSRLALPVDALYLAAMFPVFGRICTLSSEGTGPGGMERHQDPKESRKRAFDAFAALLETMASKRPLLILIDDIQWIDSDSVELLEFVVRRVRSNVGRMHRILIFATRRPEEENKSLPQARIDGFIEEGIVEEMTMGPLSQADARRLAEALLQASGLPDLGLADRISRESLGNPFFVGEMVRSIQERSGGKGGVSALAGGLSLDSVIAYRVSELDDVARRVIDTLAVAGEAIPHFVLAKAADLPMSAGNWWDEMSLLRSRRLIRCDGFRIKDRVEIYHDRIRETVSSRMDRRARRAVHERLARAMEEEPNVSVHLLARHWLAAGDQTRAKGYVVRAARRAMAKFAFDMAADLYDQAIRLAPKRDEEVELLLGLGDALAASGKVAKAADAYVRAAQGAKDVAVRLDARYKAADQMLKGGYLDRGIEEIRAVLAEVGYSMPSAGTQALVATAYERFRLKLRGLSYETRDRQDICEGDRQRMNVLWSVSAGLGVGEPLLSALFQTKFMRLALDLGDERMVAAGLAMEASLLASLGPTNFNKAERLVSRAEALARRVGDHKVWARAFLSRAIVRFFVGDWKSCVEWGDRAVAYLLEHCHGVSWELAMARSFVGFALMMRGDMNELRKRVWPLLEEARKSGDRFLVANVTTMPAAWLAEDRSEELAQVLDHVLDTWPSDRYLMHHWYRLYSRGEVLLYQGRPQEGWSLFQEEEHRLRRSFVARASVIAIQIARLRGRLAVAMATQCKGAQRERILRESQKAVRDLRAQHLTYGEAWADLLAAAITWNRTRDEDATRQAMTRALGSLSACDMALDAKAVAWRLAELARDTVKLGRVRETMKAMGVVRPERMVEVLAPGYSFDKTGGVLPSGL